VSKDADLKDEANRKLAQLTPREFKVLKVRFGIDMSADLTPAQVAEQLEITRAAIREMERRLGEGKDDYDDPQRPA
jgi:RNA polymerase primary sigma factor